MLNQSLLSLLALSSLSIAAPLVGVVPAPDLEALTSGDLSAITDVVEGTVSSVKIPRADILSEVESTAASVPIVDNALSTVEGVTAPATHLVSGEIAGNIKRFVPLGALKGTVDSAVDSIPVISNVESVAAPAVAPVLGSVAATANSVGHKRDLVNVVGDITDPLIKEVNTLAGPIEGELETLVRETVEPILNDIAGAGLGIKRDVVSAVGGLTAPVVGELESVAAPIVAPVMNTLAGTGVGVNVNHKRGGADAVTGVEGLVHAPVKATVDAVDNNLSSDLDSNKLKDNLKGNDILSNNDLSLVNVEE